MATSAFKIFIIQSFLASILVSAPAEIISRDILPSDTDPEITDPNFHHRAHLDPESSLKGQLLLFMPGTGGMPLAYDLFLENAATLGFHAIGLAYPNASATNAICRINQPGNANCHEEVRLETIDGIDRSTLIDVQRPDSVENRLIKALQHLDANFPGEGWIQFLEGQEILWSKICVSGHSQGAGHAVMIARNHEVARCLNFAGFDRWTQGDEFAPWLSQPFQTPVDRIFALAHERDEFLDFNRFQAYASLLGITRYGGVLRYEDARGNGYQARHFLSTDLETARGKPAGFYHNTMVVNVDTPIDTESQEPVFKDAWDFLLLSRTLPVRIAIEASEIVVYFSPGALEESTDLENWTLADPPESPFVLDHQSLDDDRFFRLDRSPGN